MDVLDPFRGSRRLDRADDRRSPDGGPRQRHRAHSGAQQRVLPNPGESDAPALLGQRARLRPENGVGRYGGDAAHWATRDSRRRRKIGLSVSLSDSRASSPSLRATLNLFFNVAELFKATKTH